MLPKSLRWRLPLSYAAIALLAALVSGAVLIGTLRGYYARREQEYLQANGLIIAEPIAIMLQNGSPVEAIQSNLDTFAFFSQSRIGLRDAAGQTIADTGRPPTSGLYGVNASTSPNGVPGGAFAGGRGGYFVASEPFEVALPPEAGAKLTYSVLPAAVPFTAGVAPLASEHEDVLIERRFSDQKARVALISQTGGLLGQLELSEGPAYGLDIVTSVSMAWLVASIVAVGLAGVAGWLASRRITTPLLALTRATAMMANGDLSSRAKIHRHDEIGTLAHSFNGMASQIEEMVSTLRRFAGDAAHELHTPLTALRTHLELAAGEQQAAEASKQIEKGLEQARRLEALVNDLLDLSRLEAGVTLTPPILVDLVALVRAACEPAASRAEQAGLVFRLDAPEDALETMGDSRQLQTALANLIDNAIKFTPAGGTVFVRLQKAEDFSQLSVEDSGIGIPVEDLPLLFDRFHRGRNAAGYPGSGLGLAIVRTITEKHGGRVSAEMTERGTRFTLYLPPVHRQ